QRLIVRFMAREEGGNTFFRHRLKNGRAAGLAEIFLREYVARHLAPFRRRVNVLQVENNRSVRATDLARRGPEFDAGVRRLTVDGEATLTTHLTPGVPLVNARPVREWRAIQPAAGAQNPVAPSRSGSPV